jgi:hypothetical protein
MTRLFIQWLYLDKRQIRVPALVQRMRTLFNGGLSVKLVTEQTGPRFRESLEARWMAIEESRCRLVDI